MFAFFCVAAGSALGGVLRYSFTRLALLLEGPLPLSSVWSTVLINILGSFAIGWIGTATAHGGRAPLSAEARLFLMVGVCGGFTTFSSFSLQTLDLLRSGAPARAVLNVVLSVALCLGAVALGSWLAHGRGTGPQTIAETAVEESAS